jgi:chromosome partitioning protein
MILLIGSEKGGSGKTTLATNLAVLRVMHNKDVLLLDADKQESASLWATVRTQEGHLPRIPSVQKKGVALAQELKELASRYEDIIVDVGGRDSVELRSALLVADRFYIPFRPSQYDLWSLDNLHELITQVKALNPNLKAFVVINLAASNPRINEVAEVLPMIEEYEHISFSGAIIRDRISFRKCTSEGKSVHEYHDEKAKQELDKLYTHAFEA